MTDQGLKEIITGLIILNARLRKELAETQKALRDLIDEQERAREEERKARERAREKWMAERAETRRVIRQVARQLREQGLCTTDEEIAMSSMQEALFSKFGMNEVVPYATARKNGRELAIETLAYDHGQRNEAIIVQVKNPLTAEGIREILKTIEAFPKFMPHLADRKIYGMIVTKDIPEDLRGEVLKKGLYLGRISGKTFKLQVPHGFKPKAFGAGGRAETGDRIKSGKAGANL